MQTTGRKACLPASRCLQLPPRSPHRRPGESLPPSPCGEPRWQQLIAQLRLAGALPRIWRFPIRKAHLHEQTHSPRRQQQAAAAGPAATRRGRAQREQSRQELVTWRAAASAGSAAAGLGECGPLTRKCPRQDRGQGTGGKKLGKNRLPVDDAQNDGRLHGFPARERRRQPAADGLKRRPGLLSSVLRRPHRAARGHGGNVQLGVAAYVRGR